MSTRWEQNANNLWAAWLSVHKQAPPNYNALRMILSQAQHEDHCGDDWDNYGGWGCCNLRALNLAERAAFASGDLKPGMWLYPDNTFGSVHRPDSIGTIRGDSDPNSGAFHVWFAAFPRGIGGPSYMLRAGVRGAIATLADPFCSPDTYATALYVTVCYFGGFHPTLTEKQQGWPQPRPCGKRILPWNKSEEANIADYATACRKLYGDIDAGLSQWVPPGPYSEVTEVFVGHADTPNEGDAVAVAGLPLKEGEDE